MRSIHMSEGGWKAAALACLVVVGMTAFGSADIAEPVELSNERLVVKLDPEQGYAITGLANRAARVEFIPPADGGPELDRSPWLIRIRDARQRIFQLTGADADEATHARDGDRLTITWRGVGSEDCPADLTVTVTARLPEGSAKSYWRINVQGMAPGVIWQVDFPRVMGIRPPGEDQLCLPRYWGRLWRDPAQRPRTYVLGYPQPASMQFLAYWVTEDAREPELPKVEGRASETGWSPDRSDAAGLYWAAEDGRLYYKRFAVDTRIWPKRLTWWIEHLPELNDWPIASTPQPRRARYSLPYDIAIGAFTGDYHEAAQLYLDWAKEQSWCSRGVADTWPEATPERGSEELVRWVPPWFRDVAFWAKFYHEPAKVLPEWAAYRKWLRAPMASHYYRYNISRFDDDYPEHLPPDPYFIGGIRDARALGVRPLPYINGVIWDTDTQSWLRENGVAAALKNEVGDIYSWDIHGELFAHMDPATEQWRAKMRETAEKLIVEHGVAGVYLDCLTATGSRPSYDPSAPHPCHGGCWYGQGERKLMRDLRARIRRFDPQASFFSEEIGEMVMDVMDGYLTLDQLRSAPVPGMQVFPLFTAVYHPYTINFGCDAYLGQPADLFAWEMGQMFVWGAQPLNSATIAPTPKPGEANSEFLREIVHAYHIAGKRFLQGGKWRRIAVRPPGSKAGRCGLELVSEPYTVQYSQLRDRRRLWRGPAVMASAWERGGDLAVVMVNITGESQTVGLTVRADRLGIPPDAQLVRAWPRPVERAGRASGDHRFTIRARTAAIYVLTTDAARASAGGKLDETPWELVSVEEEGELPSVEGPGGSLWACADGPVLNRIAAEGTVATAQRMTEDGRLEARRGRQAKVRGPEAEGHGLPRKLAEKPWALLRRLPHRVQGPSGEVIVFSGGARHLCCLAPAGARFTFARPGLIVATDARTGETVRPISAPPSDTIRLPADRACMVGYAALDAPDVRGWLPTGARRVARLAGDVTSRLAALLDGPADERAAALAEAAGSLHELECSLGRDPGALSPMGPLMQLHEQLRALMAARVGGWVELTAEDRWLTPGNEKELSIVAWSPSGAFDQQAAAEFAPVGSWARGRCLAQARAAPGRAGDCRFFPGRLRLDDSLYIERIVPVIGAVRTKRRGHSWLMADVLRLEADRPMQIRKPKDVLTAVAGRTASSRVTLRNWSPDDVTVRLSAAAPPGWDVTPQPEEVRLPALTDQTVEVAVAPPVTAGRGAYEVRCRASYRDDPDAAVTAIVRVALLPSLVPLTPAAGREPPSRPTDQARLRLTEKLIIYAREGEQLALAITNFIAGNYSATTRFSLHSPDLRPLVEDAIPVGGSREVKLTAPMTGAYYLQVSPGVGSAEVRTENAFVAELAADGEPFHLFCSPVTRYFYVPPRSKSFALCAQDGGPDETARFVVTSPAGRVALDRDGNYAGTEMTIDVRPGEAGKVWTLRVEPRQDVALWLKGDVCPYLAASPEGVLIEQAEVGK